MTKGRAFAQQLGPELVAAVLSLLGAAFVAGRAFGAGFPLDDAWIHMVYGAALRQTGSLAYNDGHPSTGCTSPTWAMLVGLAHFVARGSGPSSRAATYVQALGAALHAAEAVLAARIGRAWSPVRRWSAPLALGTGGLVACAPTLAYGAVSGMEVPLEGTLLLAMTLCTARGRWLVGGGLAGVAAVTRPEAALAVFAVGGLALLTEGPRVALTTLGLGFLPVGVRVARDLVVSGRPLPATFYVKANPGAQPIIRSLARGIDVMGHMRPASHVTFWVGLAVALGLGALAVARRAWGRSLARRACGMGAAAALGLAYAAGISALSFFEKPQSFYYQRYVAPPLGLMIVVAFMALAWLARRLRRARLRGMTFLPLAAGVLGVGDEMVGWAADRARFSADVASINAQQVAIGRYIDHNFRPGAVVWTIDAGAVRYWGQRPTVDLVRLNTPELFDGSRVQRAWWPAAIALIPEIFQAATSAPILETTLVVVSPSVPPDEAIAWRHEVYRCREDAARSRDSRVFVLYQKSLVIAAGRCDP